MLTAGATERPRELVLNIVLRGGGGGGGGILTPGTPGVHEMFFCEEQKNTNFTIMLTAVHISPAAPDTPATSRRPVNAWPPGGSWAGAPEGPSTITNKN